VVRIEQDGWLSFVKVHVPGKNIMAYPVCTNSRGRKKGMNEISSAPFFPAERRYCYELLQQFNRFLFYSG
jgi:hypothetical protein